MKPNSVADDILLGAKISKEKLPNGTEAWAMSSSKYVQEAVKNVKIWLAKRDCRSSSTPLPTSYRPELDISPELDADDALPIGHWHFALGR
jgi:hypothetical protein